MTTPIPAADAGMKFLADLAANKVTETKVELRNLGPGLPPEIPVVIHHNPGRVFGLKDVIESYRQQPAARTGKATVTTLQSFIDLVNRHKDEHTAIFATTSMPKPGFLAVLDYHKSDGTPRWLKHRIEYLFPVTEEWKAWLEHDGTPMEQGKFANFLEEHAAELSSPTMGESQKYEPLFKERIATPSELVTLSRDLEIHVGGKIKSRQRLKSGERQIEFISEHTNAAGQPIDIPGAFIISVAAFEDGEPVRIPARLRYRTQGSDLVWLYQMWRPDAFLRERIKEDLSAAMRETGLPGFEGTPEA